MTRLGSYVGPRKTERLAPWNATTGARHGHALDFLPDTPSWAGMAQCEWLLDPWAEALQSGLIDVLELSVPLLVTGEVPRPTLSDVVAGNGLQHLRNVAVKMVDRGLGGSIIRPGWEMNGSWSPWTTRDQSSVWVDAYRHVVAAFRSVDGQAFRFAWCVNRNIDANINPTAGWPGSRYVDIIEVDCYDYDWRYRWNVKPGGPTLEDVRADRWAYYSAGEYGLNYWRDQARKMGKAFGVGEWGACWLSNGEAGGDNAAFVNSMLDYAANPANNLEYFVYFNSSDSATSAHNLLDPLTTRLPLSRAAYIAKAPLVT